MTTITITETNSEPFFGELQAEEYASGVITNYTHSVEIQIGAKKYHADFQQAQSFIGNDYNYPTCSMQLATDVSSDLAILLDRCSSVTELLDAMSDVFSELPKLSLKEYAYLLEQFNDSRSEASRRLECFFSENAEEIKEAVQDRIV